MAKPEGEIENYLCRTAKKYGCLCMKFVSPGTDGVPDRVVIGPAGTFFVETKAQDETARKQQRYVIGEMKKHGADVYVIDSKKEIDRLFREKYPGQDRAGRQETEVRRGQRVGSVLLRPPQHREVLTD